MYCERCLSEGLYEGNEQHDESELAHCSGCEDLVCEEHSALCDFCTELFCTSCLKLVEGFTVCEACEDDAIIEAKDQDESEEKE